MSERQDIKSHRSTVIRTALLEATLSPSLRSALLENIEILLHESRALTYREIFYIVDDNRSSTRTEKLEAIAETLRILAETYDSQVNVQQARKWLNLIWSTLTYEAAKSPACAKLLSEETTHIWEHLRNTNIEDDDPIDNLENRTMGCTLALLRQDILLANSSAQNSLRSLPQLEEAASIRFAEGDYTRADLEHFVGQTLLLRGVATVAEWMLMLDRRLDLPTLTYFDDAAEIYEHLGSPFYWLLSRLLGIAVTEIAEASSARNLIEFFETEEQIRYLRSLLSRRRNLFQLWPSQLEAIRQGIFDRDLDRAAVSMPTSAGKTLVAEGLIARELLRDPDARCAYLAPTRALVSEVERKLRQSLKPLGIGVGQISAASELSPIEADIALENRLLCLTPEKLDVFLRLEHEVLDNLKLIVVDEGQLLEEDERGQLLEFAIVKLQLRFPTTRIIFLSAVIPNTDEIALWLGAQQHQTREVRSDWRPTKLRVGGAKIENTQPEELENDAGFQAASQEGPRIIKRCKVNYLDGEEITAFFIRYGEAGNYQSYQQIAVGLAKAYIERGSVLVLSTRKPRVETIAEMLAGDRQPKNDPVLNSLVEKIQREIDPQFPLAIQVQCGVAYHHGDLPPRIRYQLEKAAQQDKLDFVIATTTLAEGVNLPVSTLIVDDLRFYYEVNGEWHNRLMSARKFWNLAGRAGRALVDAEGHVIIVEPDRFFVTPEDKQTFLSPDVSTLQPVQSVFLQMIRSLERRYRHLLSFDYETDPFTKVTPIQNFLLALLDLESVLKAEENLDSAIETIIRHSLITYQEDASPAQKRHFRNFVRWGLGMISRYENLSPERKRLIVRLGVSIKSALELLERIENISTEQLLSLIQIREREELVRGKLEQLYFKVFAIPELEPLRYPDYDHEIIAVDWILGATVGIIARNYFTNEDRALSKACNYLYSAQALNAAWGINSVVSAIGFELVERGVLQDPELNDYEVSFLPAYSTYGVSMQAAAVFAAHGVERLDAVVLANWFYDHQRLSPASLVSSSSCIEWLCARSLPQVREHVLNNRGSFDEDLFHVIEELSN